MARLKRTQLYLDRGDFTRLEVLARARETSVASLVREAVAQYISSQEEAINSGEDPLWDFLGSVAGSQSDGASDHDAYLHGAKTPDPEDPSG